MNWIYLAIGLLVVAAIIQAWDMIANRRHKKRVMRDVQRMWADINKTPGTPL